MLAAPRASSSGGAGPMSVRAPVSAGAIMRSSATTGMPQTRMPEAPMRLAGAPLVAQPGLTPPRASGFGLRQHIVENDSSPAAQPAGVDEASEDVAPITAIAEPEPLAAGDHAELLPSTQDRFLGVAHHGVEAKKERTLTADETKVLHLLLGEKTHLNPKAVPPTRDDAKLLQRMLNEALGEALTPPLDVDGLLGAKVRAALTLYRRTRQLPALPNGALLDRESLIQLGRDSVSARAVTNPRVSAASATAPADVRSATGMLDLLSREDPTRFGVLLDALGISATGALTSADISTVISAAAARHLTFDDDTATRLRLAQPTDGPALPWNYTAARVVAAVLIGKLVPNRDQTRLPAYRAWAERAGYSGITPERVLEIDALVESGYNPRLTSPAGARGLHQLMPSVTQRYGKPNPFDPIANIGVARRELAHVYDNQLRRLRSIDPVYAARYPDEASMPKTDADRNDGDVWRLTWAANNAGPRRLFRYQGVPPFRETQRHVALLAWYNATLPTTDAVPPDAAQATRLEAKPAPHPASTSPKKSPKRPS